MGCVVSEERGSILEHLTAARYALETADTDTARQHIVAATRLIGSSGELCEATASAADDPNHFLHTSDRTFGHVCTAIAGHDSPHLCRCGHTWTERFG